MFLKKELGIILSNTINKIIKNILVLTILIIAAFPVTALASAYERPDNRIMIDDINVNIRFEIDNGNRYLPIRQVCEYLGATVRWSEESLVSIEHEEEIYYPEFFITDGRAYASEVDLQEIFGINFHYHEQLNVITINTDDNETSFGEIMAVMATFDGYSQEDLKWMAQIIHAESNGEPYAGKLAVGNVILNRVNYHQYPNTIKGVIFDHKHGVQFTPTVNGAIYNTPSTESYIAAVEVLEGKMNAEGALFFYNPRYAKSTWVSRNREFAFSLSNHNFYY